MSLSFSTGLANPMLKAGGQSMADALANGVLYLCDGARPANADASEGSTQVLVKITLSSGAFVSGVPTNGINLDDAVNRIVSKAVGEVWSGVALLSGTVTWFRYHANTVTTGASTTAARFDGTVSTSLSADLTMPVTAVTQSGTTTIDSAEFTMP
jgi:hypothetical protein